MVARAVSIIEAMGDKSHGPAAVRERSSAMRARAPTRLRHQALQHAGGAGVAHDNGHFCAMD